MLDSRGRPVGIGDWVASPDLSVDGGIVKAGAILGQVVEILLEEGIPTAHIGDGVLLRPWDIITLGGYIWVACLDCNAPRVKRERSIVNQTTMGEKGTNLTIALPVL